MLKINNSVLKINGDWLNASVSPVPPGPQIVYNVILNQTTGGTISATPMSGIDGTTVTLSNTPSTNYTFNGYSISGSTLYDSNKFDINGSDVNVRANWKYEPVSPYTLRLLFKDGVTPTFSKGTGVQVSSSPNIWDLTYNNRNWSGLLKNQTNLLEVIDANTTGVTRMGSALNGIFQDCSSLYKVALFDTSTVTNMDSMFYGTKVSTIPLFNTSKVTDMDYMFKGTPITSVPLLDTSSVTTMVEMFANCKVITTIPLFDTSKVTNMQGMFKQNFIGAKLRTIPLLDTSNVTNMNLMFNLCDSLVSVPLLDTSNVTSMGSMFAGCNSLTSIPLFNTSNVTNMEHMFGYCHYVQSGALALYQQASSQTTPPSNHLNTFLNCGDNTTTGSAELAQIPQDWGGTGA